MIKTIHLKSFMSESEETPLRSFAAKIVQLQEELAVVQPGEAEKIERAIKLLEEERQVKPEQLIRRATS